MICIYRTSSVSHKIHRTDSCIHNTKRNIKYKSKTILEIHLLKKRIFKNASFTEVKCFIVLYSACD